MEENTQFPGRDNYTGPTTGYFGLLHHDRPLEYSHDVMERVAYVKREKSRAEMATRLHNMIYLPFVDDAYYADYIGKRDALYLAYKVKCAPLYADYEVKCVPLSAEIITYINSQIPDFAWNGSELVFPVK